MKTPLLFIIVEDQAIVTFFIGIEARGRNTGERGDVEEKACPDPLS